MNQADDSVYLLPTSIIDSDHESIIGFSGKSIGDRDKDPVAKAVALYYAVRDGIWYDPYYPFICPSTIVRATCSRAAGDIASARPLCSALWKSLRNPLPGGLADVRNHLASRSSVR